MKTSLSMAHPTSRVTTMLASPGASRSGTKASAYALKFRRSCQCVVQLLERDTGAPCEAFA